MIRTKKIVDALNGTHQSVTVDNCRAFLCTLRMIAVQVPLSELDGERDKEVPRHTSIGMSPESARQLFQNNADDGEGVRVELVVPALLKAHPRRQVPVRKECEVCEGEAYVDWTFKHYTEEHDCPACYGNGTVETGETTEGEPDENMAVTFFAHFMRYYVLEKVHALMQLLPGDWLYFPDRKIQSNGVYFEGPKGVKIVAAVMSSRA